MWAKLMEDKGYFGEVCLYSLKSVPSPVVRLRVVLFLVWDGETTLQMKFYALLLGRKGEEGEFLRCLLFPSGLSSK